MRTQKQGGQYIKGSVGGGNNGSSRHTEHNTLQELLDSSGSTDEQHSFAETFCFPELQDSKDVISISPAEDRT